MGHKTDIDGRGKGTVWYIPSFEAPLSTSGLVGLPPHARDTLDLFAALSATCHLSSYHVHHQDQLYAPIQSN